MARLKKRYKIWKKGRYWYWRAPISPKWKSTGETNRERAEALVLKKLPAPLLDTEQITLRQYLEKYFRLIAAHLIDPDHRPLHVQSVQAGPQPFLLTLDRQRADLGDFPPPAVAAVCGPGG
jgi:hypothetical protein